MPRKLKGLSPLISPTTKVLILGSFPSAASLQKQQYYGHQQNHFWRLLGSIIGADLANAPYEEKKSVVLGSAIGIWDVYQSCSREGSLDASIKRPILNDFSLLRRFAPGIEKVCFNGKEAAKWEKQLRLLGLSTAVLPSSSPANTISFDKKLATWKKELTIH